jgi:predicted RNA-binding protein (virulence factor B family)
MIFDKEPKSYNVKMKSSVTSGAELTGFLYIENENRPIITTLHEIQVQMV